jgi:SAM-dependent methyltransferase
MSIKKEFYPDIFHPFYFIRNELVRKIKEHSFLLNGDLLDFGCGAKPYKQLFSHCKSYVGVDYEGAGHSHTGEEIEYFYNGKTLPFTNESFDSIFASEVFEHLFNLSEIIPELNRVMKTGGRLLVTCPFAWPEHEKPYDYARYTLFALTSVLEANGFKMIKTDKSGNFFLAVHQLNTIYVYQHVCGKFSLNNRLPILSAIARKVVTPIMNIGGLVGNAILPKNSEFYLNNIVVAEKIR